MNEALTKLYQGVILQYYHHPVFYEKQPDAPVVLEAYNPICGDKYSIYLTIENQIITKASYFGYGCAVSKASGSVMVKRLQGQNIETARQLAEEFCLAVAEGNPETTPDVETGAFTMARQFPGRDTCATLVWNALMTYLKGG